MSKPLELAIYPKMGSVYFDESSNRMWSTSMADGLSLEKRLTEGDLAAEFHAARADYAEARNHPSGTYWTPLGIEEDNTADMAMKRATVFLHLASSPHYDEESA